MEHKNLEYYIDRLAQGSISNDEWVHLQVLLRNPEQQDMLDEILTVQLIQLAEDGLEYPDVVKRVQQGVHESIALENGRSRQIPGHRSNGWRWGWVAALVVLALGAGGYFMFTGNGTTRPMISAKKTLIAPGREGAVLTLADGSQMMLDTQANGMLAMQSNTKIMLQNGQLTYNAIVGSTKEVLYNTITTPKGRQFRIVLPDGTKVWLNAASYLRYPITFSGSERRVEMSGEAYMEIADNARQPFILKTNGAEIQVLGTSFNVNAYDDEKAIKATLVTGSIKIRTMASAAVTAGKHSGEHLQESVLRPGQQAIVLLPGQRLKKQGGAMSVQAADIKQALAWKNGLFNFNGADLPTVMRQLERWYDISVRYEGVIPDIVFKGEMYRGMELSVVLEGLQEMGVKFRIEGRQLIVL